MSSPVISCALPFVVAPVLLSEVPLSVGFEESQSNTAVPVISCDLPASAGWPVIVHDLQARIVLVSDLTGVPLHRFAKCAYESTSHAASVADFDCFHIFVDGSDLGDQSAAWSFVVLSQTERDFFFHGALWHSVLGAGTHADDLPLNSSSGEAMAMLWAMLWAMGDSALPGCTDKFVV